ncbi:pilus assembly protein CpaC [Paucidesulfovibrio gracilis DSM 16080]|uniref:Pilus assembly protein CpaC n=1 Tax=Paucidesulfovibrio gracilis DSM 16080 TaxID=1121449 RepID=A0A1T4XN95_9BACT|nr:type II and III secretion system protein family protein [Paucidesulfovibrio gracilis]SKA90581.1 pilus assembly protein CpaC [Paucidesulfovibrio gracilis DSM 16080]
MSIHSIHFIIRRIAPVLLVLLVCAVAPARAQTPEAAPAAPNTGAVMERTVALELAVGQSTILRTDRDVTRVSLANPEAADVIVVSPRQIYLSGKAPSTTTLTLWGGKERILRVYDLAVNADVTELKRMLHQVLPAETGIKVLPTASSVTLAGTVSSTANLDTALTLAENFAPEHVVNLLQVGGVHQVMLEVRIAEMSRSVTRRLGFNFRFTDGSNVAYSLLNNLTGISDGVSTLGENVSGWISGSVAGATAFDLFLDALKTNGLAKILAEPNLVCLSGETANFLAGGEIPVPVPSGLGTLAIEYKPFGVWLEFTPTVLGEGRINLMVSPEVSELDPDHGVTIESITVPALTTRRASTTIELRDGQTFAVAGLLKDNVRENIHKVPGLGELPVLGMLFRSSDYLKEQSELVILVTPHLAKPTNMAGQSLPTDGFNDPSDLEFYLFGMTDGYDSEAARTPAPVPDADTGFDGPFGHTLSN